LRVEREVMAGSAAESDVAPGAPMSFPLQTRAARRQTDSVHCRPGLCAGKLIHQRDEREREREGGRARRTISSLETTCGM